MREAEAPETDTVLLLKAQYLRALRFTLFNVLLIV